MSTTALARPKCWTAAARSRLQRILAELAARGPEFSYQVFRLRTIEGRPGAEVAKALGLTPEQVRFRLHRMAQKFRELLDRPQSGKAHFDLFARACSESRHPRNSDAIRRRPTQAPLLSDFQAASNPPGEGRGEGGRPRIAIWESKDSEDSPPSTRSG